jgi:integrase/recombinase XerC
VVPEPPVVEPVEPGLADVVTLQRRRAAEAHAEDEEGLFADTLAEYR